MSAGHLCSAPGRAAGPGAKVEAPVIYSFGDRDRETRRYIDDDEITDLALRARAIADTLDGFKSIDDCGDGLLRCELLRAERMFHDRIIAVLS